MKTLLISLLTAWTVAACTPTATPEGDTVQQHPAHLETPAFTGDEHIIEYNGFTVSYNHTTLVPDWVAYELTAEELEVKYDNKSSSFSRDMNLKGKQASREDYSHSGWDKGHMAPKADLRWSEQSYWQSHYFTNICPQDHKLNGGDWNALENAVRRWAKQYGRVWILCGPVFDSCRYGTIGNAQVHVPDAFFKAILLYDGKNYRAAAYIMPNEGKHHPLRHYVHSVDQLEELIGRDLFPALDDETEALVEASVDWVD